MGQVAGYGALESTLRHQTTCFNVFTGKRRVHTLLVAMEKYLKAVALFCGVAAFPSKYIYKKINK